MSFFDAGCSEDGDREPWPLVDVDQQCTDVLFQAYNTHRQLAPEHNVMCLTAVPERTLQRRVAPRKLCNEANVARQL